MLKSQCQVGMEVVFGSPNGEKTRGVVIKVNPAKAKVQPLEARGSKSLEDVGEWSVPYSLMESTGFAKESKVTKERLEYNPFHPGWKQNIISAIACCYSDMSPENAHADGERSRMEAHRIINISDKRKRALENILGFEVSEGEAYDYTQKRRKVPA
jgi:hypothetical protein